MIGRFIPLVLVGLLAAACADQGEQASPPRPVRAFRVGDQGPQALASFAGEVKARRETVLSFRVAGKLSARLVDVGSRVRKGQPIARLDPDDYHLAIQSLNAQLVSARAERDFNRSDLARYRELLDQHLISPPEFDRHQTASTAARERVAALEAQLGQAKNQLVYTELLAERDGAITDLNVEVGDVVAVGQPVARLAQLDEKDVSIDIPEQRIGDIRLAQEVFVALWSDGRPRYRAKVREIAPAADPTTRTYRVQVALVEGQEQVRLGMTATVEVPVAGTAHRAIPLSAIFSPKTDPQQPRVWLVDATTETVRSVPVSVGRNVAGERIEVSGLATGQIVVTAGVQRLAEGQKVRLPKESTVVPQENQPGNPQP
ncbi:efflux RND transporter periplasmic adaptor subunit [Methylococcus sp. EFPC2]|uniref:efflux RND transporter periplasmic adaptor subunit n=1 Tax=Methylococcus sp. EFPC2 TaxID=2812648 RepID=UPI001F072F20|nr:efflux RND transporter periplasmic adaptor subunit [Methylococcus sp. EFPC2]